MATARSEKKAGNMGTFTVALEFGTPDRSRFEPVRAVADSGALFSWLPRNTLENLGHAPALRRTFVLADGREDERDVAEVPVRYGGETLSTLCVFGEEETPPILGALTMEQFFGSARSGLSPSHSDHGPRAHGAFRKELRQHGPL